MNTRVLVFEASDPQRQQKFFLLQEGFVAGGNIVQMGASKGVEILHREIEVLDAFDRIGDVPHTCAPELRETSRLLRPGRQVLELSDMAHARLLQNLEAAPWRTQLARDAIALIRWVIAATRPTPQESVRRRLRKPPKGQ